MKKLLLLLLLVTGAVSLVQGQRYAVIDSHYILDQMPEYAQAQKQLDAIAGQWQKEIETKFQEARKLSIQFDAEKVMLTDSLQEKRRREIALVEKAAQDLQKQRFGYQGDLFKKREELVKPVQDKIYNAVQKLAAEHMYDFILDRSGGISLFYYDPKLDKSGEVLKLLGIKK